MPEPKNNNLDERMASVEGDISHLSDQVAGLGKDYRSLQKAMQEGDQEILRNMREGFESVSRKSSIKWSPLIAAATAVGGLVIMYGGGLSDDMMRVEAAAIRTQEAFQAHVQSPGHPGVISRIEDLRRDALEMSGRNLKHVEHLEQLHRDTTKALSELSGMVRENGIAVDLLVDGKISTRTKKSE